MRNEGDPVWARASTRQFAETLAGISDVRTMRAFLRDVMTETEIYEMSARLEAARMLTDGSTYTDIISATGLSSRTVARISTWLRDGGGGYAAALAPQGAAASHA